MLINEQTISLKRQQQQSPKETNRHVCQWLSSICWKSWILPQANKDLVILL